MIAVIYPKDGWILQQLAEELLKRVPKSIGFEYNRSDIWEPGGVLDSGPQMINYFINYAVFQRPTAKIDMGWFTHPEKNGLFWKIGKSVDYAICNCDQYRDSLRKIGVNAETIIPGINEEFTPKLNLGFIGRFSSYGFRKGVDLLQAVNELDFVELFITDGKITRQDLPSFYRNMDYILITSRYEGGPMCLLEGVACGKKVICPPSVGFANRFTDVIIPYECGNTIDLISVLRGLFEKKLKISTHAQIFSWERWASEHIALFKTVLRRKVYEVSD